MYDCKAPLSRFYYPDTRRIINAFIIIIIIMLLEGFTKLQISAYDLLRMCAYVTGKFPVYTVCSQFKHYVGLVNLPHSSTCPIHQLAPCSPKS